MKIRRCNINLMPTSNCIIVVVVLLLVVIFKNFELYSILLLFVHLGIKIDRDCLVTISFRDVLQQMS